MSLNAFLLSGNAGGTNWTDYDTFSGDTNAIAGSTYATMVNITGSGFLDYAVIYNATTASNGAFLKITIDGTVVHETNIQSTNRGGIVSIGHLSSDAGTIYLRAGGSWVSVNTIKLNYPSTSASSGMVYIPSPLPFNESLLIEYKSTIAAQNLNFNWFGVKKR